MPTRLVTADSRPLTSTLSPLSATFTKKRGRVSKQEANNPRSPLRRGTIHRARRVCRSRCYRFQSVQRSTCYPKVSCVQLTAPNPRKSAQQARPPEPHPLLRWATAETQSFPKHHQSHSPGKHKALASAIAAADRSEKQPPSGPAQ